MNRLLPLLFLLGASFACAQSTTELLDQLQVAAKAEIRASLATKNENEEARLDRLQQSVALLGRAESGTQASANLLRAIEALGTLTTSDKVSDLSRTLARQLREEQKKQDAALDAEIQRELTSALRAALTAGKAKDLDAPIAAVARLGQKNTLGNFAEPALFPRAAQTQQVSAFLKQWQDYLASREFENREGGYMRLSLLFTSSDFSDLVPRSEFLARIAVLEKDRQPKEVPGGPGPEKLKIWPAVESDKETQKIIDETRDLNDSGEAIKKLETFAGDHEKGPLGNVVANALRVLGTLQRINRELQEGRPTSIHVMDVTEDKTTAIETGLSRLRLQLLLKALPRALELGEKGAAQPGENSVNYLNRIATAAREKQDWTLLGRTVELAQTLKIELTTVGNDRTALQSFLAGLNQERAAQFAIAVDSLETALKAGSQIVPPEIIGEHLEAIRKEHPQDYAQGVQSFLTPPIAPDQRFMDPRMRLPHFPGNPYAQQPGPPPSPPTINIPAASPASGVPPEGADDAVKAK